MNPRYGLALILLTGLLLTGCAASPAQQPTQPTLAAEPINQPAAIPSQATPVETPAVGQASPTGIYANLLQEISRQLNVPVDQIEISNVEEVEWPNGCFGYPQPGEFCADMIVQGNRGLVTAGDRRYEFRSSRSGQTVRLIPSAALAAIQDLAQQTVLDSAEIGIVQVEEVEWPDSCLGVNVPEQMCDQVITPGYRVTLSAFGQTYEYHTNLTGTQVIQATAAQSQTASPVIAWAWLHEGVCDSAAISLDGVIFGQCGSPQTSGAFISPQRQVDLLKFTQQYAPFEAETPVGKILFSGQGNQAASPAEQRMIAEWARLVAEEVATGQVDPSKGLTITWQRRGGIAGFCDNLSIYISGEVVVSTCIGSETIAQENNRLNLAELEKLYQWVDTYQSFELEQKDPAVADAMQIRLTFSGDGQDSADSAVQAEMLDLVTQIYNLTPIPESKQ